MLKVFRTHVFYIPVAYLFQHELGSNLLLYLLQHICCTATGRECSRRAKYVYESSIPPKIELEDNLGKMVILDIETGDSKVDENGLQAADYLSAKHPNARLLGIPIGYKVVASLGGVMDCVSK